LLVLDSGISQVKSDFHIPVMLAETLEGLALGPGKTIVDATVGTGGHSLNIIERILPGGELICIDRDDESLKISEERLKGFRDSCILARGNFVDMRNILKGLHINKVDGILFDLGISTFQLRDAHRGFSFQEEGPLDMRMDRNGYISAYDLINNLNEEEISSLLWNFAGERWHNRIASCLVRERQQHPIATTRQLADIVLRATPAKYRFRHYRIHPATRTFQAVRIAVNRELEALEKTLSEAIDLLNHSGRICVISFHSLEDRIVKLAFKRESALGRIRIITPKPLIPGASEMEENPASRSSKMRVAEKIGS